MLYKMIAITFIKTILCTGNKSEKNSNFLKKFGKIFSKMTLFLLKLTDDQLI